ncbi:SusC/RagA family TonB-linked outer membrane protein [Chitinophaga agrisoli]|uniref:SusC/RagA family TonB-linked outer membrane protein n=1 Tax=Chitinophaga agrisoli TaxID=2607653 RepID=A0A5B2VN02_9BACT|nr:SusC/RagA family TonB-linked outer membrane protein [Chitinophaga agrisoli]KAA2240461.1 SusC/RagA family TonB-linked outer membrane protein [Chitinophaga agrisoli]
MKKTLLFFTMLMVIVTLAFAQQRQVTGKVTGSDGAPIPFATVQIKGTNTGSATGQDGSFKLNVSGDNVVLTVRSVGYATQDVTVGASGVMNITLQVSNESLQEVVVTALGIKREKKALGYAIQEVGGDQLTKSNEQNFLNSLSGKVSGMQVTGASGAVGASTRVVLRGNNSFKNNDPLYVIDGVPINNFSTAATGNGSVDYGNGVGDLDPNNIASISVLKGANAAALYGYRAANGVILITTKNGKNTGKTNGIGVTYSGGASFEKMYILPKYQNKYGQGGYGDEYYYNLFKTGQLALKDIGADTTLNPQSYQEWAQQIGFAYKDGLGGGVTDGVDESWGPRLDAGLNLPQFNSPIDANGNRQATPWVSHPDNTKSFFVTGFTIDNSVAVASNSDKGATRLGLSSQRQMGTIPNTDQTKYSVALSTTQQVTDRLKVDVLANYVRINNDNLTGQGYNTFNPLQSLGGWFGRQVDVQDLKAHYNDEFANGFPYNWNSNYHDNPYFNVYKNLHGRAKDRIFGYASASYKFHDWLTLTGRIGNDWSSETRKEQYWNKSNFTLISAKDKEWGGGYFRQTQYNLNELNADLILTGAGKLSNDFSLSYTAGANFREYRTKMTLLGADQLTVPNLFTISNTKGQAVTDMQSTGLRSNSVFGQASFGYKSWLYLDVTARNDWSSTLPSNNWSYFYPSASLSWIFTEALKMNTSILNYGKIRASWAQVGNATNPYQIYATYNTQDNQNPVRPLPPFNGVTMYHIQTILPPVDLKPERTTSSEIGAELQFLNNRLGLDATYYTKTTKDQIMAVDISPATGYRGQYINAGEISNKGVELQLNLGILRSDKGLNWDMTINWAKNNSKVVSLYTDPRTGQKLQSYNISTAWSTTVDAIPGQPFGVIRGVGFARDASGAIIVGDDGLPTFGPIKELGNITPDWIGGVMNTLTFRNVRFSFLIDMRKGGDLFSVTDWFGAYSGVLEYTAEGNIRSNGLIVGKDVLQNERVVKADGKENDIRVGAQDYFHSLYGGRESSIIDGSYIKLRQIELGYTVPAKMLNRINFVKSAGISFFARNVALLHTDKSNRAHIDPETSMGSLEDGLGIEQYQIPSNRSIGFKLNVGF